MKIVHICLACFYVEGLGYQENIIPRFHAKFGNDVTVLTSEYAFDKHCNETKKAETNYVNQYGVHVLALKRMNSRFSLARYGGYVGVFDELQRLSPDIIFTHGGQFYSLRDVVGYVRKNPTTKLYVDQHMDYYNGPIIGFRGHIINKIIYGNFIRKAIKYTDTFWGVTPWRCQYLNEVYSVPKNKIDLLVMGGDDEKIQFDKKDEIRVGIRHELNIDDKDFVIVTGGKIDKTKNIHLLMQSVASLNRDNVKLIVFGEPNDELHERFDEYKKDKHIRHIGWIPSDKVYDYFLASDLGCFPGTHSVLWEQACACRLPCLFKDWEGMHHVDIGGNCIFLKEDSVDEMSAVIETLMIDKDKYSTMLSAAVSEKTKQFLYSEIAKKAIGME